MLERNAAQHGAGVALLSDEGRTLSHVQLWNQVAATLGALNDLGIGRGDRVGIVLPQTDLAVAFLAVASSATAAPLNPAYTEKEFLFYLEDLQARALILPQNSESPARSAAGSLGVPVIELISGGNGPGSFHLSGGSQPFSSGGFAETDDIALVLHTSGTTSGRRWCRSPMPIYWPPPGTSAPRCNFNRRGFPQYHAAVSRFGLVAGVLASLAAGGGALPARI